jgi:hypothetical protein
MNILSLLDKNGNLSSRKITKEIAEEAISKTEWLPSTATTCERLWNLHHSFTGYEKFCQCGFPITTFESWKLGYRPNSCSFECGMKYANRPGLSVEEKQRRQLEKIESNRTKNTRAKETRLKTNLEKYGVALPWMMPGAKEKILKDKLFRFAEKWITELEQAETKALFDPKDYTSNRLRYQVQCLKCNSEYGLHRLHWTTDKGKTCPTCYSKNSSSGQHEMNDWIRSLGVKTRLNDRKVFKGKFEIDIYVASANLAIEFDGLYWHSEKGRPNIKEESFAKFLAFRNKGLNHLMIFEDDWNDKRDQVKELIKEALGFNEEVEAEPEFIKKEEAKAFLEKYHINGFVEADIFVGQKLNWQIRTLMSFSASGLEIKQIYKPNTELLEFAIYELEVNKVIALEDNRLPRRFFRTNFVETEQIQQVCFYINSSGKRFKTKESEKHYRVWDLGHTKLELSINTSFKNH